MQSIRDISSLGGQTHTHTHTHTHTQCDSIMPSVTIHSPFIHSLCILVRIFILPPVYTVCVYYRCVCVCVCVRRRSWSMFTVSCWSWMTTVLSLHRQISTTAACSATVIASSEFLSKTLALLSHAWTASDIRQAPSPAVCESHFSGWHRSSPLCKLGRAMAIISVTILAKLVELMYYCLTKTMLRYFYYPRDAMLARVFAIVTCLSVCLSVRLSVIRRYCA